MLLRNQLSQNGKMNLSGVFTALVTPFDAHSVDLAMTAELVHRALLASISGVVPLGSTGESSALEPHERRAVIETVVKTADKKLTVIVGAGTNNTNHTIANVKQAYDLGADAVLVVAPYYNKPTQAGLRNHFLTVADASDLPIILYHIPSRCGIGISLELVFELATHPRIIGIKEAGGDVWRTSEIVRNVPDGFSVLSGDDSLTLPLIAVGASGVIAVISNIVPKTTRYMVNHALAGHREVALKLHHRLSPLIHCLGMETNPAPIKEAMNQVGLNVGQVRPPLAPVHPTTSTAIRRVLEELENVE